jgi:hypothetical protein
MIVTLTVLEVIFFTKQIDYVFSVRLCIIGKKENYLAAKLPEVIFAVLKTKWRVGQGVKTPPFHGGITGSNPVRATKNFSEMKSFFAL